MNLCQDIIDSQLSVNNEKKIYESSDCMICLSKMNSKITLHCGHQFHKKCIMSHIHKNNNCPYCKNIVIRTENLNNFNSWHQIYFEDYTKYFCKIKNYNCDNDYKVLNVNYIENIKQYFTHHPIFGTGTNKTYHFVSKCMILLVAFYIINLCLLYKNFYQYKNVHIKSYKIIHFDTK
jgi:hypothetical protein